MSFMNIDSLIAKWIKASREFAGISGEQLGTKLALELGTERGNTKANISHWENMRHLPNLVQVLAIAKITGTKLPSEISTYLSAPPAGETEIAGTRNTNFYALNWNSGSEIEMLSEFRMLQEETQNYIRELIRQSPKSKVQVKSVS